MGFAIVAAGYTGYNKLKYDEHLRLSRQGKPSEH